jgi:tRNA-dihydrouridine synthase
MAGITHSAFRRLVADFGGYGVLYTEMLSPRALLHENLETSPWCKTRPSEGRVIYQLRLSGPDNVALVVERLRRLNPFGLDVNLGCPAPEIVRNNSGMALFRDRDRAAATIEAIRRAWDGVLTVKCRLGDNTPEWQDYLAGMLTMYRDGGVDAVVLHPRFADERRKRLARTEGYIFALAQTDIPVIANGDIGSIEQIQRIRSACPNIAGFMIGRHAVVKPWIFAQISGLTVEIDYAEVWQRFYDYLLEDFPPERAIGRLKEFSGYYARNFFFGHNLHMAVQSATNLTILRSRAMQFLTAGPQLACQPLVDGL